MKIGVERNEIENVIYGLNENIPENYDEQSYFTYETSGYWEAIKFGEVILWDSENEPRKWNEKNKEYEDLENFIKKQFNRYVNKIKSMRFTGIKDNRDKNNDAFDAASEIMDNLENYGYGMADVNKEIKDEIFQGFVDIIEKYN